MTDFQPDPNWGDGEALKARLSNADIIRHRKMAVKILMAPAENQRLFDLVDPEVFAMIQIESQGLIMEAMEILKGDQDTKEYLFGDDHAFHKQLITNMLLRSAATNDPRAFVNRAARFCIKKEISESVCKILGKYVDLASRTDS